MEGSQWRLILLHESCSVPLADKASQRVLSLDIELQLILRNIDCGHRFFERNIRTK